MAGLPHRLLIEDGAGKFLLGIDPKPYGLLAARMFRLSRDPRPSDARPLRGCPDLRVVDQGELRIVYAVLDSEHLVIVRRVGKPNDDDLSKSLR